MRACTRENKGGRSWPGPWLPIILFPVLLLVPTFIPPAAPGSWVGESRDLHAQSKPVADPGVISLYFKFNSAELNASSRELLRKYLEERGAERRYLLIQGFGCERGGFNNSLAFAEDRSGAVQRVLIKAGIIRDRFRVAPGGVLRGEPRDPHRRVAIRGYKDERSLEYALLRATELARRLNVSRDRRQQEEILANYRKLMREEPVPAESRISSGYWIAIIVLLLVLVVILLVLLIRRNRTRREKLTRHKLTVQEADELAAITGEEPIPVSTEVEAKAPGLVGNREVVDGPRAQARPPVESVKEKPALERVATVTGASLQESIRSKLNMAAKKKTKSASAKSAATKTATKSTKPISIGRAVEKAFEGKSLSQLAKSPINALEGLTPRHARMLEEGFGIKTIEDLAQLKYFEIARAIVVLAKYE